MMVDTNVIIDLRDESRWFDWSLAMMSRALGGSIQASAVVVGELASRDGTEDEILALLKGFRIQPVPVDPRAGYRAGLAQRQYRQAGGTRERLLGDFLVGAHAASTAQPLLTRDARRYLAYFPELTLITPETHPNG